MIIDGNHILILDVGHAEIRSIELRSELQRLLGRGALTVDVQGGCQDLGRPQLFGVWMNGDHPLLYGHWHDLELAHDFEDLAGLLSACLQPFRGVVWLYTVSINLRAHLRAHIGWISRRLGVERLLLPLNQLCVLLLVKLAEKVEDLALEMLLFFLMLQLDVVSFGGIHGMLIIWVVLP